MDSHTPGSASAVESTSKKRSMAPCMVEIPRDNNKQEDCVSKWMNLAGLCLNQSWLISSQKGSTCHSSCCTRINIFTKCQYFIVASQLKGYVEIASEKA